MLGTGCLQTQATGGCNVKRNGENREKWNVKRNGRIKKLLGPGCPRPKLRGGAMSIIRLGICERIGKGSAGGWENLPYNNVL